MTYIEWLPHQVLWIEAADTLPFAERMRAFRDIAAMVGDDDIGRVQDKSYRLRLARERENATGRHIVVPERYAPNPNRSEAQRRVIARAA